MRNGYGEMNWLKKGYYKGHWKNGVQNGQGLIYTPEQGVREGKFINNELISELKTRKRTLSELPKVDLTPKYKSKMS